MLQTPHRIRPHIQRAASLTGHKFFVLFLVLLISLVIYPYAEGNRILYFTFRLLGTVVILLSVYAVSFRRGLVILALILAVPAFLQHAVLMQARPGTLPVLNVILSFAFDVFVVVVIFRRVFVKEKPNSETIFGALCLYLLVAFSFSSVYGMVTDLQPQAFYLDPATNLHVHPNRFDFIYYSFGTITCLGAPGIVPVSPQARSLTVIESILGVLYLAVLISRLMGAYRRDSSA